MPVPDKFVIADDFAYCEFCDKCYPMGQFRHAVITNDETGEVRRYSVCSKCLDQAKADKEYEKYITEKTFALKLGVRRRSDNDKN